MDGMYDDDWWMENFRMCRDTFSDLCMDHGCFTRDTISVLHLRNKNDRTVRNWVHAR